jgi:hypothetical protein
MSLPPNRRPRHHTEVVIGVVMGAIDLAPAQSRSQRSEATVVACPMKRRLGPIFNAANDVIEQALIKTSLAELVRDIAKFARKV